MLLSRVTTKMLIPVCCFSCNRRVGPLWVLYGEHLANGMTPKQAMGVLGVTRQCCQRMLLSTVELNTLLIDHETAHSELQGVRVERTCDFQRTIQCD